MSKIRIRTKIITSMKSITTGAQTRRTSCRISHPLSQSSVLSCYYCSHQGGTGLFIRQFYFTVDVQRPELVDQRVPYCEVYEDTRNTFCSDVINNPATCRLKRWEGKFYFEVSFLFIVIVINRSI